MTILEMRQKRATLIAQAKGITDTAKAEDRDLTEEEEQQVNLAMNEADSLEADITTAEQAEQLRARVETAAANLTDPVPTATGKKPVNGAMPDRLEITQPDAPWMLEDCGRLAAFENTHDGRRDAYRAGMFVAATVYQNPMAQKFCLANGIGLSRSGSEQITLGAVMQEGNNLAGGYLVPTEMSARIVYLRDRFGLARRMCFVEPMASDKKTISRQTGNVTVYYPEEGGEITASDQTYGQVTLNARKAAALLRYSSELDEDSFVSLGERVTNDMGIGFAESEDDAWINGDGGSTYGGILGMRASIVDGTHTAGAQDATSGDNTLPEIISGDLDVLLSLVPQYTLDGGNLRWLGSQVLWARVFGPIIAASGGTTMREREGGPMREYLGIPYESTPKMPNNATTDYENTAMLFLGDFRMGCTLGTRRGFRNTVLRERYAELDQIGIVATERFDIVTHELGDNTNPGPIVALIGN